jgi:hypothetical protein
MRQIHEHASPGRAVCASARRLLGSGGLIVVVLANTEVQGGPQNSENGDKGDAQQGNDDDEDQGCGHGAGIVAARILSCHRRLLRHRQPLQQLTFPSSSGSRAMLTAIRRASSAVNTFACRASSSLSRE